MYKAHHIKNHLNMYIFYAPSFFFFGYSFFFFVGFAICMWHVISRTPIILRVRRPSLVPYTAVGGRRVEEKLQSARLVRPKVNKIKK